MKRPLVLAAAAVVLLSNLWVLISAGRNRAGATGGTIELTERELALPSSIGDSTVVLLDLRWDVSSADPDDNQAPDWLNEAKLAELGFDCRVSVTSPQARDHYASQLPMPVYLVLEYEGEAWKTARHHPGRKTHLFVVDAGRGARRLRDLHPDTARSVICQGVVNVFYQDRSFREGTPLAQPRLRGRIEVIPGQIFVPPPHCRMLQSLRRPDEQTRDETDDEPRFAVTVSWGTRYEPWVRGARRLPELNPAPNTP